LNLDGLKNLTSVEDSLIISLNSPLTNLDELKNLTSVGGRLTIVYDRKLLFIQSNTSLPTHEIEALTQRLIQQPTINNQQ
jgi:hypothetical protein